MTLETFKSQMERIKHQYGEKYYSKERLNILWSSLQNSRDDWFELACNEIIANSNRAPVLKDFIDAMTKVERAAKETQVISNRLLDKQEQFVPDNEFAAFCSQVIRDTLAGKLNAAQRAEAQKIIDSHVENTEKQKLLKNQGVKSE